MNLAFLFKRKASAARQEPREPSFSAGKPTAAVPEKGEDIPVLPPPELRAEVHNMSPRQMQAWAHEMYLAGAMNWHEYQTALPAELHVDYNCTIGALTGEMAAPDRPRDMMKEWEDRLEFFRRHNPWDASEVRRTERVVILMRRQANPHQWAAAE